MIKIYNFEHNEKQKLFFVSDTHFNHNRDFLYEKRGFTNILDHDETLIKRWNSVVRPEDIVWHLGDHVLGAGRDSEQVFRNIFNYRLNGTIYTLWGNHTAGAKQVYRKAIQRDYPSADPDLEIYPTREGNVIFMGYNALIKVNYMLNDKKTSQHIFMSHFAHRIWIDMSKGVIALSGHSHGSDKESNPDYKLGKRLDVGIENFGEPIPFDKVMDIMKRKQIVQIDHHGKDTSPSF